MTWQQILDLAAVYAPSSMSTANKCLLLAQQQRRATRLLAYPNDTLTWAIVADTATYSVPAGVPVDRMQYIVIDDGTNQTEYQYLPLGADPVEPYYSVTQDSRITFVPTPAVAGTAYLYYGPQPTDPSDPVGSTSPSTPADYHIAYVWALAAELYLAQDEIEKYNNYETKAAAVIRDMLAHFSDKPRGGFRVRMVW